MPANYWKKVCGIEVFKLKWYLKYYLYKGFGIKLPKIKNQSKYWRERGRVYMEEILSSGYLDREVFFQDMLTAQLKKLEFDSFFEAGCGFGWNVRRVKEEFPTVKVGGVDFSDTQLQHAEDYMGDLDVMLKQGDICQMPLEDNAYDIGFSLGVFMNIHPSKIREAAAQMVRVCRKYIIHIEYDQDNSSRELREKRAFKTNIVSHDYKAIYESLGMKVLDFKSYLDFGDKYREHVAAIDTEVDRWEGFEGPEKYIMIVVEVPETLQGSQTPGSVE
ncbi:MAG: class I SAM-dependent methyltransferase [bacterium]|nr:class I SAM-dependent methyltransferase [bacterium]